MGLDIFKLEKAEEQPGGKIVARCPACAEDGHDNKGNHLVVYPDGRFGCAAHQGDQKHRQRIWRLVGESRNRDQTQACPPVKLAVRKHPHYDRWSRRKGE